MDLGLKDKVALVTGSSRGIGRSIALGFADEGCHVSLSARGEERLLETEREVAHKGVETLATAGDLTTAEGIERIVKATLERWGRIDILVNNVGGSVWNPFDDVSDDEWLYVFNLNMFAAVRATRAVLPSMRARERGSIITISPRPLASSLNRNYQPDASASPKRSRTWWFSFHPTGRAG